MKAKEDTSQSLRLRHLFDDARGRVILVIVGDLVLLHRSGLAGPKAIYLVVVVFATIAAIPAVRDVFADPDRADDRYLALAAAAIGAVALLSLPVSLHFHNAPTDWIRDVSVYGLVAVAPALAFDLRRSAGPRWVSWSLIATGAVATISYAAYWMNLRGYARLPFDRAGVLLPSFYLPAALLSFASAKAIRASERERAAWGGASLAIFAVVVATGTRTSLILLAAPLVQVGLTRHRRALAVGVAVVVLFGAALAIAESRGINLGTVGNRLASTVTFVHKPGSDPSWFERREESRDALAAWRRSPVLGVGAGHQFHWRTFGGVSEQSFLIDTPTGFLAKFGLIGVLVVLAFIAAAARVVSNRLRFNDTSAVLPLAGFFAVALCGWALGVPFEDKGFPIGFLLTYALALPGRRDKPLPAGVRRRRSLVLAAFVAATCVVGALGSGRFTQTPPSTPSIEGRTSPALRVVAAFELAVWEGDGVSACNLLTAFAQSRYGSAGQCQKQLSSAGRGDPRFAGSRVTSTVAVRDGNAKVVQLKVRRRDGRQERYLVTKVNGNWLISWLGP
jgi:hypothetical protein